MAISLLTPRLSMAPNGVNISRDGLCLRVRELLEVRSLIRFQLTAGSPGSAKAVRAIACTGRVAWVTQRLDLSNGPPFLYDVGVEFVDPSPALRQLLARRGATITPPAGAGPSAPSKSLEAFVIRGRRYLPRLDRDGSSASPWHLVVAVEGVPCFSGRYATERAAVTAWLRFKRQQARREGGRAR